MIDEHEDAASDFFPPSFFLTTQAAYCLLFLTVKSWVNTQALT